MSKKCDHLVGIDCDYNDWWRIRKSDGEVAESLPCYFNYCPDCGERLIPEEE